MLLCPKDWQLVELFKIIPALYIEDRYVWVNSRWSKLHRPPFHPHHTVQGNFVTTPVPQWTYPTKPLHLLVAGSQAYDHVCFPSDYLDVWLQWYMSRRLSHQLMPIYSTTLQRQTVHRFLGVFASVSSCRSPSSIHKNHQLVSSIFDF